MQQISVKKIKRKYRLKHFVDASKCHTLPVGSDNGLTLKQKTARDMRDWILVVI